MMIKFIGPIPIPVFVTDNLPDWVGGRSYGWFIQIRPKYIERNDQGIIAHELRHCLQFYRFVVLALLLAAIAYPLCPYWSYCLMLCAGHPMLYLLSDKYRLYAEVDAYKEQIKAYGLAGPADWMLSAIQNKYRLNVTQAQIVDAFKS